MLHLELPTLEAIFNGELAKHGHWVVANLKASVAWPVKVVEVVFRSRSLFLIPATHDPVRDRKTYPALAVRLNEQENFEAGQVLLSHFLSSLSWVAGQGISVTQWTGGSLPSPMGIGTQSSHLTEFFYQPYLPDPQDKRARWALAFYREGLSLNNTAYQCLSFFKVLNILWKKPSDQIDWINKEVENITHHRAVGRVSDIRDKEGDVGQYLYGSNRCAVAHAGGHPTVDPEDPLDLRRLDDDLPLVQTLAELAIEKEFGIESKHTVYQEHLYELEGFRELFGAQRVSLIKENGSLTKSEWPQLPNISVRLALHKSYKSLEDMTAYIRRIDDGAVVVLCKSKDELTQIFLILNFREERLQIDVNKALHSLDDGSEKAMRDATETMRFVLDYVGNGILEIWDFGAQRMLGRCDAFIPMNIDPGAAHRDLTKRVQAFEAEAELRMKAMTDQHIEEHDPVGE